MNQIQISLNISPKIDYAKILYFDQKKGFYCMKVGRKKKCMNKNKGRRYSPMSYESKEWLREYYKIYNQKLVGLLNKLGEPLPLWLNEKEM